MFINPEEWVICWALFTREISHHLAHQTEVTSAFWNTFFATSLTKSATIKVSRIFLKCGLWLNGKTLQYPPMSRTVVVFFFSFWDLPAKQVKGHLKIKRHVISFQSGGVPHCFVSTLNFYVLCPLLEHTT